MSRPAAIVTGASRGIGRAIALRLAREGFDLVLAARTEGALLEAAAACEAEGVRALAVPTDVTREDDVKRLFEKTLVRREGREGRDGFGRLDVLVNNAGGGVYKPVADTTLDDWERVMAVNARGIRVHVICPGGVATGLISEARPDIDPAELLRPEDVADLVAYLVKLPKRAMIDLVHLRRSTSRPF